MITFPEIGPNVFSISIAGLELALRWYALSYIVGFVFAFYLMTYLAKRSYLWAGGKSPIHESRVDSLLTYLIIGVIVGGRLGYVIFYNLEYFSGRPFEIIKVWNGGMSFHGGFLGVIIALFVFCYTHKIKVIVAADLIAFATPPGLMLGRVSNFINGELWGKPTIMPWGVIFPGAQAQNCPGFGLPCARHPSQLYEAGLEGVFLFLLLMFLIYRGALRKPGQLAGVFMAGYGLSRFFVEYYRVPDVQFFNEQNSFGFAFSVGNIGLTMGQVLSIPMILVGIAFVLSSVIRQIKDPF
jgi:phosphatidylglycerol:prolipoprotein diacylglycerol transferase